ncbi:hypothetical protein JE941_000548 [Yersinia ruckeri]|nr:hypothetical protein [Yersinia ruckeri]
MKKLYKAKCAGGCGVVPFPWGLRFFRGDSAALAGRGGRDPFRLLRRSGVGLAWHIGRLAVIGDRRKKARVRRAGWA